VEAATSTRNALKKATQTQLRHAATASWQKTRNLTLLTIGMQPCKGRDPVYEAADPKEDNN
jgi:hypothetical protein